MQTPRYIFKTCLIRRICLPRLIVPPPARSGPALLSRSTILAASVLLERLIIVYERKRWAFTVAFEIAPEYQENPPNSERSSLPRFDFHRCSILTGFSPRRNVASDFDLTRGRSGPKRIEALKAASRFTLFPSKLLLTVIFCLRRRETRLPCVTVTGGYPEIKKACARARARETREEETERTAFAEVPSRATERS